MLCHAGNLSLVLTLALHFETGSSQRHSGNKAMAVQSGGKVFGYPYMQPGA